jgi:hypothetical protein
MLLSDAAGPVHVLGRVCQCCRAWPYLLGSTVLPALGKLRVLCCQMPEPGWLLDAYVCQHRLLVLLLLLGWVTCRVCNLA